MRVLYTRGPLLGPLIRRVSAVPVDHCGLLIGGLVWDVAMLSPVQPRPLAEWVGMRGRRLVYEIEVPLADEVAGANAVVARAGRGYDYLGTLGIPLFVDAGDGARDYCTELPNHYIRAAEPALLPPRRGRWDVGASLGLVWAIAAARGSQIHVH